MPEEQEAVFCAFPCTSQAQFLFVVGTRFVRGRRRRDRAVARRSDGVMKGHGVFSRTGPWWSFGARRAAVLPSRLKPQCSDRAATDLASTARARTSQRSSRVCRGEHGDAMRRVIGDLFRSKQGARICSATDCSPLAPACCSKACLRPMYANVAVEVTPSQIASGETRCDARETDV